MAAVCTVSIFRISITFTSLFIQYHSVNNMTGIHIVIAEFLKKTAEIFNVCTQCALHFCSV